MKKLMWGEKVIGEYPDDWTPPEHCDIFDGIKDGSMSFIKNLEWPDVEQQRQRAAYNKIAEEQKKAEFNAAVDARVIQLQNVKQ